MLGNYYLTERLRKRIDKLSLSSMENGLVQFFFAYYTYYVVLNARSELQRLHKNDDDDLHALTMNQMMRPFYFVVSLWIASIVGFVAEIVVFKWNARRQKRSQWAVRRKIGFLQRSKCSIFEAYR